MKHTIFETADSYKFGHPPLLRKDVVSQYNYMESRGGKYPSTVSIGLQYLVKEYLLEVPTKEVALRFEILAKLHGVPFDTELWDYIIELGHYPIEICAIDEGTLVPTHHVLATIESTNPKAVGIVGFLETLLMKVWMPTLVATQAYYTRKMLCTYGSPEWAQFAYHNFGDRSATSVEHALNAGFAHLTQFMGTDCFGSLAFAEDYYNQPITEAAGYSVIATEHSITTMNTEAGEEEFVYTTILNNPNSNILSFVGDSYDIYNFTKFCTSPASRIRKLIESRPHQKLVIRPDSGDHIRVLEKIITIMRENEVELVEGSLKILFKQYGLLWGDGITYETMEHILQLFTSTSAFTSIGYAAENFVFGSGTDLINSGNRDTQKFAIKCSSVTLEDGTQLDVFKDPITDPGKASKKGRVTTWYDTETKQFIAGHRGKQPNMHCIDIVTPILRNGVLLKDLSLAQLRNPTIKG